MSAQVAAFASRIQFFDDMDELPDGALFLQEKETLTENMNERGLSTRVAHRVWGGLWQRPEVVKESFPRSASPPRLLLPWAGWERPDACE